MVFKFEMELAVQTVYWGATSVKGKGRQQDWAGAPSGQDANLTEPLSTPWRAPRQSPMLGGNSSFLKEYLSSASPPLPQRHSVYRE